MDISSFNFKDAEPAVLELLNPSDGTVLMNDAGDEPLTITLYGSDSDTFRKAVRAYGNKKLNQKGNKKQSVEELEQTSSRLLANVTQCWSNIVESGELLECTEKNAMHLYTEYPWIREQVDEFVNERSNFLTGA